MVHSVICATSDYLLWKQKVLDLQQKKGSKYTTFIAFKMAFVHFYTYGLEMLD